jgi:hypothetical protein
MTDTATQPMTEAQREKRRQQARTMIENRLQETWAAWRRHGRKPDFSLAAAIAVDSLGDLAAEILVDGTMMRSLTIKDGVATLELGEATEIVKIFVASMRGMLDGYGAENYLETEMTAPSVSMDVRDGWNPRDSYTVTIQRRTNPTPHEFRQRAEAQRDAVLRIVGEWACGYPNSAPADALDLVHRLKQAGHRVPGGEGQ